MNYLLKALKKAITRLEEVLEKKKTSINRDSAIKRFELCFDLCWKAVKNFAREQGLECYSPKSCFKTAFQLKLIDQQKQWLEILVDRNLTAHLYNEKQADKVYSKLKKYHEMFEKLLEKLSAS